MKKYIILAYLTMNIFMHCEAQSLFNVQFGNSSTYFEQLDSAVASAPDGATIYIPGGTFSINTINIVKKLNLIGVGHHPDSNAATSATYLTGNINFSLGADYSSLIGIYLTGNVSMDILTSPLEYHLFIARCNLNGIVLNQCSGTIIQECIIRDMVYANAGVGSVFGVAISNSILVHGVCNPAYNYCENCNISNNIFIYNHVGYCVNGNNSIIKNNLFLNNGNISGVNYCFNNISISSINIFSGQAVDQNNQYNISDLCINQSGNTFSYSQDYHLTSTSPGKNIGTDGTDAGIYGGSSPWKDGAIPYNPHIQFYNIPASTDAFGNINVNIKVGAQDH